MNRRRALILLLAALLAPTARARQVEPQIALRGVPLADALQRFVERTGESVAYDPALVRDLRVYCVSADSSNDAWLQCLLEGTGLEYFRRGSGTYVIGPRLELPPDFGIISGRVVERDRGAPLPGAHVLLADAGRGTAADGSGRFAFDRLLPGRYGLVVTHVGFSPWVDSLDVEPGGRTSVMPSLRSSPISISPIVVEAGGFGSDPWSAYVDAAPLATPSALERAAPLTSRLADRAGVSLSDVTADVRVQGGSASDVSVHLDGVPVFLPRSIAGFVGIFPASALDRIGVHGAGFGASTGGTTGGVLDLRHALEGPDGLDVQADPYAVSGRIRWTVPGQRGPVDGFLSIRRSLTGGFRPASIDRALRAWSAPDPFLLVAPLRQYQLATEQAIGYGTGLFVPATPTIGFDDLHAAARWRPSPSRSWDASVHAGRRNVSGARTTDARSSDLLESDRPLFSSTDRYDWSTRMAQIRHERVIGSRTFLTAQTWATSYELVHDYRLADRLAFEAARETNVPGDFEPTFTPGESLDGNRVDAWGLTASATVAHGRHTGSFGVEAGHVVSRFDLRLASIAAGTTASVLVPVSGVDGSVIGYDTTTVFRARHAEVSNRADESLLTAYATDQIHLGRLLVEPGLRATWRPSRNSVYAEPRLRVAWSVSGAPFPVRLSVAGGLYRQFVQPFDISSLNAGAFFPSTRIWLPLDASIRPPWALHGSVDASVQPFRRMTVSVGAWVKDLRHTTLFDYAIDATLLQDGSRLTQADLLTVARGLDEGITFAVAADFGWWTGRVGYERGSSWRRADRLFGGRKVPTVGFAPHRWTLALDVAPSRAWDLGLRAEAEIGRSWALRPVYYDYFGHDSMTSRHGAFDLSDPGSHRLPALIVVDVTTARAFEFGPLRLQIRGEIRNLLGRANELDRRLLWDGSRLATAPRTDPDRTAALAVRLLW